jgi:hypothetical protein
MKLDQYNRLKTRIETLKREHDREAGAYQNTMDTLKEEFGCSSLEDAKRVLSKLKKKTSRAERDFDRSLSKFIRKHKDALTK